MRRRKFKINITELPIKEEDRSEILVKHKHITELKLSLKPGMAEDTKSVLKNELIKTRSSLNNDYAHKFYQVSVCLGPHKFNKIFSSYPEHYDVVSCRDELLKRISKNREGNKIYNKVVRTFNGLPYDMQGPGIIKAKRGLIALLNDEQLPVQTNIKPLTNFGGGRTFTTPGTIVSLLNSPAYQRRIRNAKNPYDKSKYVGVELELIARVDQPTLEKLFIEAKLAGNVYCKHDGSIRMDEHAYGKDIRQFTHEITILAKQHVINDVIERVCKVLNSIDVDAYVNDSCGLHVHLDMRQRKPALCYNNLYQVLNILQRMVPYNRTNNKYCVLNNTSDIDESMRKNPNPERDVRYQAINTSAMTSHSTIEVRLHSGSTNAMKINNWINILTAVVDKETIVPNQIYPEGMTSVFGISESLVEYIIKRINKFKDTKINNKQDHMDLTA